MTDPKVIAELARIADDHGGLLRAPDVVDAARDVSSPLHEKFEWDDSAAAEQFRLQQARQLIRVCVQYIGSDKDQFKTRVFVSLTPDREQDGGGYRPLVSVMNSAEYRRQLLYDAMEELKHFRTKYEGLKELADVFAAINKVPEQDVAA